MSEPQAPVNDFVKWFADSCQCPNAVDGKPCAGCFRTGGKIQPDLLAVCSCKVPAPWNSFCKSCRKPLGSHVNDLIDTLINAVDRASKETP